jgi:GT2 family glycosyltransferase
MNSSRIAVIVRAFQRYKNLPVLIHSFLAQTDPRWTLYVVHDGPDEPHAALMQPFVRDHPNIRYQQTRTRHNDYGHTPTSWALQNFVGDESHVLFTNDDNYYMPVFVEYMLRTFDRKPETVMVASHCVHNEAVHHNGNRDTYGLFRTHFRPGYIDLGAYVTDARVAKAVGYNSTAFEADAVFVQEVREKHPDPSGYVVLDHALFVHN